MTVREAIEKANHFCPNQYTDEDKIAWLSNLDGQIFIEIISRHHCADRRSFDGYDAQSADDELIVPAPYADDVYINYLMMQICKANAEYDKYNQLAAQYNSAMMAYRNWYNREHMPLGRLRFRW